MNTKGTSPLGNKHRANPVSHYCVYILQCADGTLYTGITTDVKHRLVAHNAGKGAKYTRGRLPVALVFQEDHEGRSAALQRELAIKRMTRHEKNLLIEHYHLRSRLYANATKFGSAYD